MIELRDVTRTFLVGDIRVRALRGISLNVTEGEFVAVMGTSGSGKSTLMNILGGLDYATTGDYFLDGVHINELNRRQLADIRNQKIGFVFQGFNLLPRTTALENVELPLLYDRTGRISQPRTRARQALQEVGLGDRMHHDPTQLSGGQQQRVAIARALVNEPAIILADEPTGNLDSHTSREVMALFQQLNDQGKTIILVTHDAEIAQYTMRIIRLLDGRIISDQPVMKRRNAAEEAAMAPGDENNRATAGKVGGHESGQPGQDRL
ncbi:ABC transporter ATP-binding protein [bacterium]|nr:ABC transporter ATP-binding protein [candidate division CSSED10-310 bacterium]